MSLTKTDLEFFDLKAKTLKCLEVKYKSPVTCCPKNKMGKPCFSCPEINGPINFNNKNNNNNNNNNTFSHTSQAARVLGVIHTAKRMVSSQTPWTSWSRFTSVPGKYAVWRRQTELSQYGNPVQIMFKEKGWISKSYESGYFRRAADRQSLTGAIPPLTHTENLSCSVSPLACSVPL